MSNPVTQKLQTSGIPEATINDHYLIRSYHPENKVHRKTAKSIVDQGHRRVIRTTKCLVSPSGVSQPVRPSSTRQLVGPSAGLLCGNFCLRLLKRVLRSFLYTLLGARICDAV